MYKSYTLVVKFVPQYFLLILLQVKLFILVVLFLIKESLNYSLNIIM